MRRRLAIPLRVLAIVAVAACLWFFIHKIEWSTLWSDLADAKLWPLVLAAALNFTMLFNKALCWKIMLAPKNKVPQRHLFRYTIVAFAASVLAPARAGELLRLWLLKRRDGVATADSAGVAVAEKLFDGVSLLVMVAPVHWLLPDLPSWVTHSILACAAVAVVLLVALYIAVGRVRPDSQRWFARFIAGMHVLHSRHRLVLAMLTLWLVWIADGAMVLLVGYGVGIHLSIGGCLLILFTLNLAIMAPSTPASVGALEVGMLAATRLLGIADEPAFALALLYHVLQVVPLIAVGLLLEWRLVLGKGGDPAADLAVTASTR